MNDLPAIVAWVVAVLIAVIVAVAWRLMRSVPKPGLADWRRRVIAWVFSAAILGPIVTMFALTIIGLLTGWREVVASPLQMLSKAMVAAIVMSLWNVLVALLFFVPPYLPILMLWARNGPRLGWLELSRRGSAVTAILLGLPAAVASVIAYGSMEDPFGFHGAELLKFGMVIWLATSVSLFVPRVLISGLRPGVFSMPSAAPSAG